MAQRKEEPATPGFEQALERLEQIVQRMEAGEMGLDEMVAAFEEGQRLVKLCTQKLNEVERRIELLVKTPDGCAGTEPFEAPQAQE